MARHRNIRGRNFDEDYEGYDDVYGHSVEDDYGVSPSTAEQFLYQRGGHELSHYLEDIGEDDGDGGSDTEQLLVDSRNYQRPKLSDVDEARLQSCLDEIRNVVGDTTPEHILIDAVVTSNFDYERALDVILNRQEQNRNGGAAPAVVKTDPTNASQNPSTRRHKRNTGVVQRRTVLEQSQSQIEKTHKAKAGLGHDVKPRSQKNMQHHTSSPKSDPPASHMKPFQPYYDIVSQDSSVLHLPQKTSLQGGGIGEKPLSVEGSRGVDDSNETSGAGLMQFMPANMQIRPPGMKGSASMHDKTGPTLSELSQGSDRKRDVSGGKLSQKCRGGISGLDAEPDVGKSLSSLASSHFTGQELQGTLTLSKQFQEKNFGDLVSKQGSPETCKPKECSSALSALAASHHSSSIPKRNPIKPEVKTSLMDLKHMSLADLASGHLSKPSTILQVRNQGKTLGRESMQSSSMSLADLAAGHKLSSGDVARSKSVQINPGMSGIKAAQGGSPSLADLASSHLSSSPDISGLSSVLRNNQTGEKTTTTRASSLGGSHSAGSSALGRKESRDRTPGCKSAAVSGSSVSLADLASSHSKSLAASLTPEQKKSVPRQGQKDKRKPDSRANVKAASDVSRLDTSENPCASTDAMEGHPRVPPGFESLFPSSSRSTVCQVMDGASSFATSQPTRKPRGSRELETRSSPRSPEFDGSNHQSGKSTSPHSAKQHTAETAKLSNARSEKALMTRPSIFGLALCHRWNNASPKAAAIALGRVGYHGHRRRVLHRQFSFERQKSRLEEMAEEKKWPDIIPFDFSKPSPDDIVLEKQKRGFFSGQQTTLQ